MADSVQSASQGRARAREAAPASWIPSSGSCHLLYSGHAWTFLRQTGFGIGVCLRVLVAGCFARACDWEILAENDSSSGAGADSA